MDTIAAIATAPGAAAISVVRVSGEQAIAVADRVFQGNKKLRAVDSHTAVYGFVVDPDSGERLDEVLALVLLGPRTYTKDDTVEFSCHGGDAAPQAVLAALLGAGARLALPGEFTQRAFLSGRIDLAQAEAVADIIGASGRTALSQAQRGLNGDLGRRLKSCRENLHEVLAFLQAGIDYPEEDLALIEDDQVALLLEGALTALQGLVQSAHKAKILKDGATIVIAGRPNVGKSSLYNLLSGRGRALVSATPGTTRDVLESSADLDGFFVYLSDTAGIRQADESIESAGIELALDALHQADMILWVIDGSCGLVEEDITVFRHMPPGPVFLVVNKADLLTQDQGEALLAEITAGYELCGGILISALEGRGVEELTVALATKLRQGGLQDALLANLRQDKLAREALVSLEHAREDFLNGLPEDIVAVELEAALRFLGEITGESVTEDIVHEIFSRFCVGK